MLIQTYFMIFQIAIPFDHVDEELIAKPQRWQPEEVGRFMVVLDRLARFSTFLLLH